MLSHTSDANWRYARPTAFHWSYAEAISSQNGSSLLALMYVLMATGQQSQSTLFLRLGQHQNLFVTLQTSLAWPSSTHISFIILSCRLRLCANLHSTNTLTLLHHFGQRWPRRLWMTWSVPLSPTPTFSILITGSWLCCAPTFQAWALVMCFSSLAMMQHPCKHCWTIGKEGAFVHDKGVDSSPPTGLLLGMQMPQQWGAASLTSWQMLCRRLRHHQQNATLCFWAEICLCDGLLFCEIPLIILGRQPCYSLSADAPYVLRCQHHPSTQLASCWHRLLFVFGH